MPNVLEGDNSSKRRFIYASLSLVTIPDQFGDEILGSRVLKNFLRSSLSIFRFSSVVRLNDRIRTSKDKEKENEVYVADL